MLSEGDGVGEGVGSALQVTEIAVIPTPSVVAVVPISNRTSNRVFASTCGYVNGPRFHPFGSYQLQLEPTADAKLGSYIVGYSQHPSLEQPSSSVVVCCSWPPMYIRTKSEFSVSQKAMKYDTSTEDVLSHWKY